MQIDRIPTPQHEQVLYCQEPDSGLRAFIAIHDTTLGPALGGCRMWHYPRKADAKRDVLRLSAGMTAKAALADVPFGGGKAVILGNPRQEKTPEKLRAFGRFVESLGGAFITGEDVGMSPRDIAIVAQETAHVSGLDHGTYASGDPSPVTAMGVFLCLQAAAAQRFGSTRLEGRVVALQGLGHVGMALAGYLHRAGATLIAADVNTEATAEAQTLYGAKIVAPEDILAGDADIFAPCALGGILNRSSIARLRAKIVCGAANNQLADPEMAMLLAARDVLYCPDYVVNVGGLLNVAREALSIAGHAWREEKLRKAVAQFETLLRRAEMSGRPPLQIAEAMVAQRLARSPEMPRRHLG